LAADCIDTFNLLGSVPIQLQAHQTRVTLSHSSCMYTTAPVDVGKHGVSSLLCPCHCDSLKHDQGKCTNNYCWSGSCSALNIEVMTPPRTRSQRKRSVRSSEDSQLPAQTRILPPSKLEPLRALFSHSQAPLQMLRSTSLTRLSWQLCTKSARCLLHSCRHHQCLIKQSQPQQRTTLLHLSHHAGPSSMPLLTLCLNIKLSPYHQDCLSLESTIPRSQRV